MTVDAVVGSTSVCFVTDNVSFYEETRLLDKGKLTITESSISWNGEKLQFSLAYPNICLHAVSRDPYGGDENVKFPHPHLLLMVDGERVWSNGEPSISGEGDTGMEIDGGEDVSGEENGTDFPTDEEKASFVLRFVPSDQNDLDSLYDAIAECQALNPDPEDFSENEFEDVQEEPEGDVNNENGNGDIDPENFTDD
ncbi:unnamed protein product [Mesocestoides corti]|uniref:Methylosome subunit pICln n=1 Tax=Mesocestoides corti TaxID=53468 RepID=A0A0R3U7F2_MESCO|nr:unnamed protein product [Mesocestoides corti]